MYFTSSLWADQLRKWKGNIEYSTTSCPKGFPVQQFWFMATCKFQKGHQIHETIHSLIKNLFVHTTMYAFAQMSLKRNLQNYVENKFMYFRRNHEQAEGNAVNEECKKCRPNSGGRKGDCSLEFYENICSWRNTCPCIFACSWVNW